MTIIVVGNPLDGFTFVGPFEVRDDAVEYGQTINDDWWLADVTPVTV